MTGAPQLPGAGPRGARAAGARHRGREVALRVAYEADATGDPCADVWRRVRAAEGLAADPRELVDDIVNVLAQQRDDIDARLRQAAEHWPLERLSATDRAVLRVAVAELVGRAGSPVPVVIDEAIELAKRYGSDESGRFVNGVLDRIARDLRPGEV